MTRNPPKILVIQSDISELNTVEMFLKEMFEINKIPEKFFNKVFLCASEAVVNAIEHGNKSDINKKIVISAFCDSNQISIKVRDEGEGFDLSKIKDPTKDSNILCESGRGIHIIKSIAKHFDYDINEKCIEFKIECCE